MPPFPHTARPAAPKALGTKLPASRRRLRLVYVLLAIFQALSITASLRVTAYLHGSYDRAIQVNQQWDNRLERLAQLRQMVSLLDSPARDIGGVSQPDQRRDQIIYARQLFAEHLTALEGDLPVSPEHRELAVDVAQVRDALQRLFDAGNAVLDSVRQDPKPKVEANLAEVRRFKDRRWI